MDFRNLGAAFLQRAPAIRRQLSPHLAGEQRQSARFRVGGHRDVGVRQVLEVLKIALMKRRAMKR